MMSQKGALSKVRTWIQVLIIIHLEDDILCGFCHTKPPQYHPNYKSVISLYDYESGSRIHAGQ